MCIDSVSSICRRNNGFSLIELSIVMVIVGLIVSMGFMVFGPSMKSALKSKNETIVQNTVDSLIGFAGAHKYLPDTNLTEAARSKEDALQWDLEYKHATGLQVKNSVCDLATTDMQVTVTRATPFTIANVAFIVWSKGNNTTSEIAGVTAGGVTTYTIPVFSDQTTNYVDNSADKDDVSGWATLSELKAAADCGPDMRISVASQTVASNYAATFNGVGGVAPYSWCVASGELLAFTYNVTKAAVATCTTYDASASLTVDAASPPLSSTGHDYTVYLQDSRGVIVSRTIKFTVP